MATLIQLEVIGEQRIQCAGCEGRIAYALRRLSGVQDVIASASTQQVSVTVDPERVTPQQIRQRLDELGYQVE